jgi:hypothetical protein
MNTWTTKDGRTIAISDMSDDHVINAHRMLQRAGYISRATRDLYMSGPIPTGDMAEYYFWQEFDEVLHRVAHPAMDDFENEMRKRRIGMYADPFHPQREQSIPLRAERVVTGASATIRKGR